MAPAQSGLTAHEQRHPDQALVAHHQDLRRGTVLSDRLTGPAEILIENDRISEIAPAVHRPSGAQLIDLLDRTVSPASSRLMFT